MRVPRPDRVTSAILQLSPAELHRFVDNVASILYWDSDKQRWNPNKEWDSAADFLDMINDHLPTSVVQAIAAKK